jgi:hypothetical protein
MLVHDGEQAFKSKLALLDTNDTAITSLQALITENHKEVVTYQKKLKGYLEGNVEAAGKPKKKLPEFNNVQELDKVFAFDFLEPTSFLHLNINVVLDEGWCWDLAWRQLGVVVIYCLPLTAKANEQLERLCLAIEGIKVVAQLKDDTEVMSVNVEEFSEAWSLFFAKLDSFISIIYFLPAMFVSRKHSNYFKKR